MIKNKFENVQFQAAADQVSLSLSYLFITYNQTRKYLAKLEHIICRTKVQITVSPLLLQWHVRSLRISRKTQIAVVIQKTNGVQVLVKPIYLT